MPPAKFEIYVDQSVRQPSVLGDRPFEQPVHHGRPPVDPAARAPVKEDHRLSNKVESIKENKRFYFDERKLFPLQGGEFSIEEVNYTTWMKRKKQLTEKMRMDEMMREIEDLKTKNEVLTQQITILMNANKQLLSQQTTQPLNIPQCPKTVGGPPSPTLTNRLSIVPQSLQPAHGLENFNDMSVYGAMNDAPSVVQDFWKNTFAQDKFTLPIDQSQYIKDNVPTSTPTSKRSAGSHDVENKKSGYNNRRMSRPSMGGSPTLKLSPITETSRDCNSKSSSSSSASTATTPSTVKKALPLKPLFIEEPERSLDPNDPSTYLRLLRGLPEPLDRRAGFFRMNQTVPLIKPGACFQAGPDSYLVDKELSNEARMYTAQLLTDDTNDSTDIPIKTVCLRVDHPANEWLFYICNELHRRLVRQKTSPDIELSVMIANPGIIYRDGSILIDEFSRFVSLQSLLDSCVFMNRPFPKSMAAYITLELIQLVRQIHTCEVIHMNICPKNILITCCPGREDIAKVDERTSVVKLIGFDRAIDMRLLPSDYRFEEKLDDLMTCQMVDSKPWSYEIDWFGALSCMHKMFFLDDMTLVKNEERDLWWVDVEFHGLPTQVWQAVYDEILNISDLTNTTSVVDKASDELSTWVKANINFVLKEADSMDRILEEYCKATNKSIRT